jgi:hypothetical protein
MCKIILILAWLLPLSVCAQTILPMGGKANSMANSIVAMEDVWSFHHNPGALARFEKVAFGICYENRFLLKELQSQGLVYVQPLKKGVISAGAQIYGFDLYRSTRIGAGYSLLLADNFSAGVQMNYQGIQLREQYGSLHSVTAELGLLVNITDKWKMGCSVFNLGRAKLSAYQNERMGTIFRLGTSYKLSNKVLFTLEADKNIFYPIRVKTGMDYQPLNNFFIRAGLSTEPLEGAFGMGYKFNRIQLDLGTSYHQTLGWSPHFSIQYSAN